MYLETFKNPSLSISQGVTGSVLDGLLKTKLALQTVDQYLPLLYQQQVETPYWPLEDRFRCAHISPCRDWEMRSKRCTGASSVHGRIICDLSLLRWMEVTCPSKGRTVIPSQLLLSAMDPAFFTKVLGEWIGCALSFAAGHGFSGNALLGLLGTAFSLWCLSYIKRCLSVVIWLIIIAGPNSQRCSVPACSTLHASCHLPDGAVEWEM